MIKTLRLQSNDITEANNNFKDVNEKKSYLQDLIISRLLKKDEGMIPPSKVIACCFTRFGKTYLAKRFLERFKSKFPDMKNYVVVPSKHLKKEWTELGVFDNVFVVNSFTMKDVDADKNNVGLVVYDECHHYSNDGSMYFSTAFDVLSSKYSLALSATLEYKHLSYMYSKGFTRVFMLPFTVGKELGIIPDFSVKNVPVELTKREKKEYVNLQDDINTLLKPFLKIEDDIQEIERLMYAVLAPIGEKRLWKEERKTSEQHCQWILDRFEEKGVNVRSAGSIIGLAEKITVIKKKQRDIVQNSDNKIEKAIEFCNYIEGEKTLMFCSTTAIADTLASKLRKAGFPSVSFHSKMKESELKDELDKFYAGVYRNLISIGKLKEGFTVKDVKYGMRLSYSGSKIDATQITGRVLSFDENDETKESMLINLYVDKFTYNDEEYPSMEIELLENAYKNFDVVWCDTIEKALEKEENL